MSSPKAKTLKAASAAWKMRRSLVIVDFHFLFLVVVGEEVKPPHSPPRSVKLSRKKSLKVFLLGKLFYSAYQVA